MSEPSTYNCLKSSSKFEQRFNLTKHIKSVHTQDQFKCDQCASSFTRRDNLEKHNRRKHTVKKCDECDFTTYSNLEFANHKLRNHPPDDYIGKSVFNGKLVKITFEIKEENSPLLVFETYRVKVRKILKQ